MEEASKCAKSMEAFGASQQDEYVGPIYLLDKGENQKTGDDLVMIWKNGGQAVEWPILGRMEYLKEPKILVK